MPNQMPGSFNEDEANSYELKQDYERAMETQLGEMGARMQEWARLADAVHLDGWDKLRNLRELQRNAAQKLRELKYAGDQEDWTRSKESLDQTWANLQNAWREFKGSASAFKKNSKNSYTMPRRS